MEMPLASGSSLGHGCVFSQLFFSPLSFLSCLKVDGETPLVGGDPLGLRLLLGHLSPLSFLF